MSTQGKHWISDFNPEDPSLAPEPERLPDHGIETAVERGEGQGVLISKRIRSREPEQMFDLNGERQPGKKQNDENDASECDLVDATKHDEAEHGSRYQGRQTNGKVDQEF